MIRKPPVLSACVRHRDSSLQFAACNRRAKHSVMGIVFYVSIQYRLLQTIFIVVTCIRKKSCEE